MTSKYQNAESITISGERSIELEILPDRRKIRISLFDGRRLHSELADPDQAQHIADILAEYSGRLPSKRKSGKP